MQLNYCRQGNKTASTLYVQQPAASGTVGVYGESGKQAQQKWSGTVLKLRKGTAKCCEKSSILLTAANMAAGISLWTYTVAV